MWVCFDDPELSYAVERNIPADADPDAALVEMARKAHREDARGVSSWADDDDMMREQAQMWGTYSGPPVFLPELNDFEKWAAA